MLLNKKNTRYISVLTLVVFVLSMFGSVGQAYANTTISSAVTALSSLPVNGLNELNNLQANLKTAQSALSSIERVSAPLYNAVMPSNIEAMSIGERVKAILCNAKNLLGDTYKSSSGQAKALMSAGVSVNDLTTDQKLAYAVDKMGDEVYKLGSNGKYAGSISKLKTILASIKQTMNRVITSIRAKIFSAGQKLGLIDENLTFEDVNGKTDSSSAAKAAQSGEKPQSPKVSVKEKLQNLKDTAKERFSSGLSTGVDNAKASLKSSFSFSTIAVSAAATIGTNLAIDAIHGEKPSIKKAVSSVLSLEFAANYAGSALGAAGGQVAAGVVRAFVPGIAGALIGSVIPAMFSSAAGQLGSNLAVGLKHGEFSLSKAWKAIDKVDLVGSSIGSSVGMMLGSLIPIPVVGTVLGSIVGGFVGGKAAKWLCSLIGGKKPNKNIEAEKTSAASTNIRSVTLGTIANTAVPSVGKPIALSASVSKDGVYIPASERLKEVQKLYYDTYLEYNRLIEANDQKNAKIVFKKLQEYSDEYLALKKAIR